MAVITPAARPLSSSPPVCSTTIPLTTCWRSREKPRTLAPVTTTVIVGSLPSYVRVVRPNISRAMGNVRFTKPPAMYFSAVVTSPPLLQTVFLPLVGATRVSARAAGADLMSVLPPPRRRTVLAGGRSPTLVLGAWCPISGGSTPFFRMVPVSSRVMCSCTDSISCWEAILAPSRLHPP